MSSTPLPKPTVTGALGAMHLLAEYDEKDTLLRQVRLEAVPDSRRDHPDRPRPAQGRDTACNPTRHHARRADCHDACTRGRAARGKSCPYCPPRLTPAGR